MGSPQSSDPLGGRKVQVAPVGTTVYYGWLSNKKHIAYRVTCTCGGTGEKRNTLCVPHEIRVWAEKHGDCKREFRALKALEEEQYSLLAGHAERTADPRYSRYQKRMRELGFYSSVTMLEAKGYCLPEEAQETFDSLYPRKEQSCQPHGRDSSSTEESAGQSQDSGDVEYTDEEASNSTACGRRRRPKKRVAAAAAQPSRKRARKAAATGLARKAKPAESRQSRGVQDAAPKNEHSIKRARKARAVPPASELHAAAVAPSVKAEPATSTQASVEAAAADIANVERRACMKACVDPSGQLISADDESAAAAVKAEAPIPIIKKAEPAGTAEPPVTPDAAAEGTRKRRRTTTMQPDLAPPTVPKQDAPVDSPPVATQCTPARGQTLNDDMDGAVDLTLDSPAFSAGEGSPTPKTRVYTLSEVIGDITRLKAVESHIAAGGVDINIDGVLQCLQAASVHEKRNQELEVKIAQLQAEASAERRNHQALMELQRQAERKEKLLEAKNFENRALREQVERLELNNCGRSIEH